MVDAVEKERTDFIFCIRKIDVSVNAPQAGKVVELLVNEEDTVAVGQDLFRIEFGAAGEGNWMELCL